MDSARRSLTNTRSIESAGAATRKNVARSSHATKPAGIAPFAHARARHSQSLTGDRRRTMQKCSTCGSGQDKPGCLGPSAERPGCFFICSALLSRESVRACGFRSSGPLRLRGTHLLSVLAHRVDCTRRSFLHPLLKALCRLLQLGSKMVHAVFFSHGWRDGLDPLPDCEELTRGLKKKTLM